MAVPQGRATSPRLALAARALLALTAVVVAIIVFVPGPPDESGQLALARWLDRVHRSWMPGWITFGLIEFLCNVLMFLPLSLFGSLALRRRRYLVVPACVVLSCVIELVQWTGLPERDSSWQDVVANTIGAVAGYLLAVAALRRSVPPAPHDP